ncbi:Translation machinery-associated protein [Aspergillus sp. HF37]|nr:Translation machinery-associated protein [Aspergillus sp. HF37]
MARTYQKVHKHVSKKKGAVEALHENSRDANRIRRAAARDDRVARVNATMSRGRDLYIQRIGYFQENTPDSGAFSDEDMMELVRSYINRGAPEIEQLQSERRKGRPPGKREEALIQRTEAENKELRTGFWVPDITQDDVVERLKVWKGDWLGWAP